MRPAIKVETRVRAQAGGFLVTAGGGAATTPRANAVVVPSRALAHAIADEIAAAAAAPNFRIAAGAIDEIAADPAARRDLERELVSYGATDLVCLRAERPTDLVARESAAWDPLCAWFAGRFGARLAVAAGMVAAPQPDAVGRALGAAVAARDPFRLAALSLATRAAGSIVIGLALCEGSVSADAAFAAAVVEETYQEDRWGADRDAARSRAVKRLDLARAARFLGLLSED